MKQIAVLYLLVGLVGLSAQQGRVAPGVPPQQYQQPQYHQQPPPPPQYQQVPVHQQQQVPVPQHHPQHHVPQQQVPVQHHQQMPQQVPVQHQVPVQQHQVPVAQQQHQYGQPQVPVHHAAAPQQILNVAHMAQEKEHLKEHLHVPVDTNNMSEQELQFHYFKMHDADNNNKLDGCELIKSLIHWHVAHSDHLNAMSTFTDDDLQAALDMMLQASDKDNDGFLTYAEYTRSLGGAL
ncbi:multiple coagulation factor deficiency protein 2 homolog isoform X2 [Cloeon dipterum]|uniref:multiple coagulation factor deficiency protein 2 homolog isoform X2 n=1 Tax=Cloeon dipterum TaxID=197152 RepID=UPI00321F68D8